MGLLGFVGDLISKPKVIRNYYDDSIRDAIGPLTTRLGAAGKSNDADLAAYSDAVKNATAKAGVFDTEDAATLGGAISKASKADGLGLYERLREGNLSALKGFAGDLSSLGSRDANMALASRGYGGRGMGSYEQALRMDRISKNLAPVASGIFSGLAPGVSTVSSADSDNLNNLLTLINARFGVPFRTASTNLMPALARNELLGGEIGNLGGLGEVAKSNVSGFQVRDRPLSTAMKNLNSEVMGLINTAVGAFAGGAGGMLGGGAGGILGGLLGGGGKSSQQPQAPPPSYSPYGYSSMMPPTGSSGFTFTGR